MTPQRLPQKQRPEQGHVREHVRDVQVLGGRGHVALC